MSVLRITFTKSALIAFLMLSFAMLSFAACGTDPDSTAGDADGDSDGDTDGDGDGDTDGDTDGDSDSDCVEQDSLAFITTDYSSGAAGLADLRNWSTQINLITIHSDSVVRCLCDSVVVIERLFGDNLTVLTNDSLSLVAQHSLGTRSNPQDAWFDNGLAYVSLFGEGRVIAVDLETGATTDQVDLTSLADEDGNPETSMMSYFNGRLYVTLQLLDRNAEVWALTGPGKLAVLTLDPLALESTIQLQGQNPTTDHVEGGEEGIIYIGHAGSWSAVDDGGIERVNLLRGESDGFVVTGDTLGGNVVDFIVVNSELGFATVSIPGERDILLSFNPSTGETFQELASSTTYSLTKIIADNSGHFIVTDRDPMNPGLRVFSIEDGSEITTEPMTTGLAPSDMCLVRTTAE